MRSPFAVSAALFAVIIVLRFSVHSSQRSGILLLLVAPIVVMSLAYRPLAGMAIATAAFAAYLVGQFADSTALDAVGTGTRAFTFYVIPLTIWLARTDPGSQRVRRAPDVVESPAADSAVKPLTARELEVLGLVAAGRTNAEIAEMLVLSVRTIESHRASLRRKLGHPSAPELVHHAVRQGVLPTDPTDEVPDAFDAKAASGVLKDEVQ